MQVHAPLAQELSHPERLVSGMQVEHKDSPRKLWVDLSQQGSQEVLEVLRVGGVADLVAHPGGIVGLDGPEDGHVALSVGVEHL